jgi:hypothetical protein
MIEFLKEKDKQKHIAVTFVISFTVGIIFNAVPFSYPYIYGFVVAFGAGVVKEICDDIDYGVFDKRDILADIIGGLAGSILFYILTR